MRNRGMGHGVFALALIALGLLSLFSGDFASVWQPVPLGIPARAIWACVSGAIMCVAGFGLLIRRSAVPMAMVLMVYTSMWLLVLHVPTLIAGPMHEINWGACAEIVVLVAGAWIVYASRAHPGDRWYVASLSGAKAVRAAQIMFALAIPFIGIEHLVYAQQTADYVPAWLPNHLGWAYFTGMAHVAAGAAILFKILPRLAAALETVMMGIFTVLVWLPLVVATPMQRFNWTALLMSTLITAGAWIVADSYRRAPWLSLSPSRHRQADLATR